MSDVAKAAAERWFDAILHRDAKASWKAGNELAMLALGLPMTPEAHHVLHCESRPIERMASLESCPKRAWHSTQEAR